MTTESKVRSASTGNPFRRRLVAVAIGVVVIVGLIAMAPRIIGAGTPPPGGSPPPTASPRPTDPPGDLVKGPGPITDEDDGFGLELPDGWYTNGPGTGDGYSLYAPGAFDPDEADPTTVPILITVREGGQYGPGGHVFLREELTIAGYPALHLEIQGVGGGQVPPNALRDVYLVALDGEPVDDVYPGRWLVAELRGEAGDYEANQDVLSELLGTLEVLER